MKKNKLGTSLLCLLAALLCVTFLSGCSKSAKQNGSSQEDLGVEVEDIGYRDDNFIDGRGDPDYGYGEEGPDNLVAIITDPSSEEFLSYKAAGTRNYKVLDPGWGGAPANEIPDLEDILIVSLKDNVKIIISTTVYLEENNALIPADEQLSIYAMAGEVIKLSTIIPEGIPSLIISIECGEQTSLYWPIQYDETCDSPVIYLEGFVAVG